MTSKLKTTTAFNEEPKKEMLHELICTTKNSTYPSFRFESFHFSKSFSLFNQVNDARKYHSSLSPVTRFLWKAFSLFSFSYFSHFRKSTSLLFSILDHFTAIRMADRRETFKLSPRSQISAHLQMKPRMVVSSSELSHHKHLAT